MIKKIVLALIVLAGLCLPAHALVCGTGGGCFWVGGTGTWDGSTTTHWASTSGGVGGVAVPSSTDAVTFNGSSGGGTVTVNTTVTVVSITCGAFTGTLDFSANNNSVTLSTFNCSGTGTRTLNLGNGTWTMTGTGTIWNIGTTTGLTFNANSSVLTFTATSALTRNAPFGGLTYSTVTISANSSGGTFGLTGANTIATLNVSAPNAIVFPAGITTTITNAFTWNGSSGSEIGILSSSPGGTTTISVASGSPTMAWAGVRDVTFSGGATFTATNSFDLGHNSGITITAPSSGGGGGSHIIGGGI